MLVSTYTLSVDVLMSKVTRSPFLSLLEVLRCRNSPSHSNHSFLTEWHHLPHLNHSAPNRDYRTRVTVEYLNKIILNLRRSIPSHLLMDQQASPPNPSRICHSTSIRKIPTEKAPSTPQDKVCRSPPRSLLQDLRRIIWSTLSRISPHPQESPVSSFRKQLRIIRLRCH